MNLKYDYVTFGQVQQKIINYYEENKEGLSFRDAIIDLKNGGEYKNGIPEKPDFRIWNLLINEDFRLLINKIPIKISEIFSINPYLLNDSKSIYLPTHNSIQIHIESCYAPENFIALDYFVVIYVLKGSCTVFFDSTKRNLSVGEVCILPPSILRRVHTSKDDIVLSIMSDKSNFEKNFFQLLNENNILSEFFRNSLYNSKQEYLLFMIPPSKEIKQVLQQLFQEFVNGDEYSENIFNNYLQIFYTHIIRSYNSTYNYYINEKELSAKASIPAIIQFINENYRTLTLGMLAQKFHYDSTYLSKLIKSTTGKSYSEIVTNLKLTEAKKLLENTQLKIDEISELIGYNSSDHFSYIFKLYTGLSPRKYRNLYYC